MTPNCSSPAAAYDPPPLLLPPLRMMPPRCSSPAAAHDPPPLLLPPLRMTPPSCSSHAAPPTSWALTPTPACFRLSAQSRFPPKNDFRRSLGGRLCCCCCRGETAASFEGRPSCCCCRGEACSFASGGRKASTAGCSLLDLLLVRGAAELSDLGLSSSEALLPGIAAVHCLAERGGEAPCSLLDLLLVREPDATSAVPLTERYGERGGVLPSCCPLTLASLTVAGVTLEKSSLKRGIEEEGGFGTSLNGGSPPPPPPSLPPLGSATPVKVSRAIACPAASAKVGCTIACPASCAGGDREVRNESDTDSDGSLP